MMIVVFVAVLIQAERIGDDDILFTDFEDANWPRGWTASADFPFPGPISLADTDEVPTPDGFLGSRFVSTFKGDNAKGTVTSPEFIISKKYIRFSIAGGFYPDEAYIGLFINGELVNSSTGYNGYTMMPRLWDVQAHIGKTAQIKIVDNTAGGWGFILIDEIWFTDLGISSGGDNGELVRQMGLEGTVLLENKNNALPLAYGSTVAVFGKNQNNWLMGGGGSGEVYAAYSTTIKFGLHRKEVEKKLSVFPALADWYAQNGGGAQGVEPAVPADVLAAAKNFADAAIISFSREAGEMLDRNATPGDYYLSDDEKKLVDQVIAQKFGKVIVIMNQGNVVDSSWYKDREGIDAVLVVWFPGLSGGIMVGDILVGDGYPSGKLVDTFAKTYDDYSTSATFHAIEAYVEYEEDVYVGYRYFETIPGAAAKVNYEFGYGLSYTEFTIGPSTARVAGDNITVETTVKNTGKRPGKEVVQVYASAPQGKLGKPAKVLVGFQKTRELGPGEAQTVQITFPLLYMASYDDLGHVAEAAWVLEEGDYAIYVGNSVRQCTAVDYKYHLDKFAVVKQLTHQLVPKGLKRRLLANGSYEDLPAALTVEGEGVGEGRVEKQPAAAWEGSFMELAEIAAGRKALEERQKQKSDGKGQRKANAIMLQDVAKDRSQMPAFLAQFSDLELATLFGGRPARDTGGIGSMPKYGVPNAETNDGPAGARISGHTTQFPSGTMVACSWNPELQYAFGVGVAVEMKRYRGDKQEPKVPYGTSIWLAPGMNIHRNPLCGRNFEYYSEDPLVSGLTGANVVKGHQSKGCAATPKHFAGNEREWNRGGSDARMSERAAREVYLRNFEVMVREGDPWCMMTSYNVINGQRPTESVDLLTNMLRNEWGFTGIVMTDWSACCDNVRQVIGGNEVSMPGGAPDEFIQALGNGTITRAIMERAAERIMNVIMKTHVFSEYVPTRKRENEV